LGVCGERREREEIEREGTETEREGTERNPIYSIKSQGSLPMLAGNWMSRILFPLPIPELHRL